MFDFFIKGVVLGFAIAAPVGPVGILCIRKTLQFGKMAGFCAGLGAATADAFYGSLAVFGLTFLSTQLLTWGHWIRLLGSFFLLFLSYRTFLAKPVAPHDQAPHISFVKDFIGTFFLTLTNPLTVICYLAVFAAMGWTDLIESRAASLLLIFGVFIGAALWWLILSEGIGLLRHKLNHTTMIWINRTAGFFIGVFGIWNLTSLLLAW